MKREHAGPEEQEFALFREEMEQATRHRHDKAEPFKPRLRPHPRPPTIDATGKSDGDDFIDLNIETGDQLLFVRPGIQRRLLRELRRGHLSPQQMLDLHGLRVREAKIELAHFLGYAIHQRLRVVHIIHGRGFGSEGRQPILKQKVNQWLRQRDEVLAFCSAPRFDGGEGAVYVLLSRKAGQLG